MPRGEEHLTAALGKEPPAPTICSAAVRSRGADVLPEHHDFVLLRCKSLGPAVLSQAQQSDVLHPAAFLELRKPEAAQDVVGRSRWRHRIVIRFPTGRHLL